MTVTAMAVELTGDQLCYIFQILHDEAVIGGR